MNNSSVVVNLAFTADTTQVRQQLQQLQTQLTNLSTMSSSKMGAGISGDIQKAAVAAAELKTHLNNAMNPQTGTLDFTKLNQSITQSGKSLQSYGDALNSMGVQGKQAFMQLANSVAQSEIPLKRSNKLLTSMATTFKNTLKWQLSSSILHGFVRTLSSAYNYAQDLNESLNNIRIVTGYNVDQMSRFAEQANKAARALSTTTTDYTNASLIYFQQGLNDAQVKERTDVTIKMANVSRQSAEIVSDQMTAVWNNFYDGSKSLEYYADVMTALGAATASSTDEIAQGLEKFAAISNTVGLSYEYATAALATVTAETRQSADVVGTAFKTMFARIEGLKLGDTLEDGTTYNQYSEALLAVGVNIKEANGELKDMDQILSEMAGVWQGLARDEKVALAQKVAGIRQYNQLISLMDNWDVMEDNLKTVSMSGGTLERQSDIYAESWEAASKRVKAATEDIWDSLLNDKFFIKLLNGFDDFLGVIGDVIDSLGGMKGLLLGLSAIMLKVFSSSAAKGLTNMAMSMSLMTAKGREAQVTARSQFLQNAADTMAGTGADTNSPTTDNVASSGYKTQLQLQDQLTQNAKNMSELELATCQQLIQGRQQQLDKVIQISKELDKQKNAKSDYLYLADSQHRIPAKATEQDYTNTRNTFTQARQNIGELEGGLQSLSSDSAEKELDEFAQTVREVMMTLKGGKEQVTEFDNAMRNAAGSGDKFTLLKTSVGKVKQSLSTLANNEGKKLYKTFKVSKSTVEGLGNSFEGAAHKSRLLANGQKGLDETARRIKTTIDSAKGSITSWSQIAVSTASSISSLAMSFSMLSSLTSTLKNPDIGGWEKFTQTLMTMGMLIPSIIFAVNGLRGAYTNLMFTQTAARTLQAALMSSDKQSIAVKALKTAMGMKENAVLDENTAKKLIAITTDKNLTMEEKKAAVAQLLNITNGTEENVIMATGNALRSQSILGRLKETAARGGGITSGLAHVAVLISEKLALWGVNSAAAPLIAVLLMLAVAIGGVVLVGKFFASVLQDIKASTPEGKLEAAKEKAQGLGDAFSKVSEAAEELRSTIDGYDSAVDKLAECTRGTQEWNEAFREVNNSVLNLLSLAPQLATMTKNGESAITYGEDGELVVADWAKEQVLQETNAGVLATQAASVAANQEVREAQTEVDRARLARNINSQEGTTGYAISTTADGQSYTEDKSGQISRAIANNASELANLKPEDQRKWLQNYIDKNGIQGVNLDQWAAAISELGPEIGDLAAAVEANTKAKDIENRAIASQEIEARGDIDNHSEKEGVIEASGKAYEATKANELKRLEEEGWGTKGIAQIDGVNQAAKDVWAEYLQAAGLKASDYKLTDTTGDDSNRKFVYEDSEGNEKSVSLDAMREIMASAKALEAVGASAKAVADKMLELGTSASKVDNAMKNFLSDQDFTNATKDEADAVTKFTDIAKVNEYLDDTFGDGEDDHVSEETAQKYGYKNHEEWAAAIQKQAQAIQDMWDKVGSGLSKTAKEVFDTLYNDGGEDNVFEGLTYNQTENMGEIIQKAFELGGKGGADKVAGYMSAMFTGAGDKADELAEILENMDWQNASASEFSNLLSDAGINIDSANVNLEEFIKLMYDISKTDFDTASQKFNDLQGVISTLKDGENLSPEDYAKLGEGFEDYFIRMADGTYKLIGDAEDFYNAVNNKSIQGFEDNVADLTEKRDGLKSITSNYSSFEELAGAGYDNNKAKIHDKQAALDQVNYLKAAGYEDTEQLAEWENEINSNRYLSVETISALTAAVKDNAGAWGTLSSTLQTTEQELVSNQMALGTTAKSLGDLETMKSEGKLDGLSDEQYEQVELAVLDISPEAFEQYVGAIIDGSEELTDAIKNGNEDQQKSARETAERIAKGQLDAQKSLKKSVDVYDKYKDSLDKSKKGTSEFSKACAEMAAGLNETFGADVFDAKFVEDNLNTIKKAMEGNADALAILQDKAAEKFLIDIGVNVKDGVGEEINDWIGSQEFNDLEIGATLDDTGMTSAFQSLLDSGAMTVEQLNTLFSDQLGFDPIVDYKEVSLDQANYNKDSNTYTVQYIDDEGNEQTKTLTAEQYNDAKGAGVIKIPIINGKDTVKVSSPKVASRAANNGGGGGGGGGSKPAKPVKKTHKSDVVKRYKELDDKLDDIRDKMEKVNEQSDRMFGAARLKKMREGNQLLKQEIDLLKKRIAEAKKHRENDKKELKAEAEKMNIGLDFDANNNITNYEEVKTKLFKELSKAEDHMNSLKTEDAQSDYSEKTLEPIKEKIELLDEFMERFEGTQEEIEEMEKELQTLEFNLEDGEMEVFEYELELKITIDQNQLDYLEFLLSQYEDFSFSTAEKFANVYKKQPDLLKNQATNTEKHVKDLLKKNDISKEDRKKFFSGEEIDWSKYDLSKFDEKDIDLLKTYVTDMQNYATELIEINRIVHEDVNNSFDEWNEKIDRGISKIDHYKSMIGHLQTIADLTKSFNGMDFADFDEITNASIQVTQDRVDSLESSLDANKASLKEAQDAYNAAVKTRDSMLENGELKAGYSQEDLDAANRNIEYWNDSVEQFEDKVMETEEELYSTVTDLVQQAADQYDARVEQAFKTFEKTVAGQAGSLEELETQMDRMKTASERYLKDYEQIYELTKLNRKITNSMDETSNIKAKQELKKLQQEINQIQKEGIEMSQYDLEYMQKKYELKLAQIALEEAQSAKNQVRLTRNAEGNYSYTYTADQSKVDEAQQNYEDKLYELQDLSDNYLDELQSNIVSTQLEYEEAMNEILEKRREGFYKSTEEFDAAVAEIDAYYTDHLAYMYKEMDKALGNNATLYESDWKNYNNFVGGKIKNNSDFQTSFEQTTYGIKTGFSSTQEALGSFTKAVGSTSDKNSLLGTLNTAFNDFQVKTNKALEKFLTDEKGSPKTVKDAIKDAISGEDGIIKQSDAARQQVHNDAIAMKDDLQGIIDAVELWEKGMVKTIGTVVKLANAGTESFNKLYKAAAEDDGDDDDGKKNDEEGKKNDDTTETKTIKKGAKVTASSSSLIYDYAGDTSGEYQYFKNDPKYVVTAVKGDWVKVRHHTKKASAGWFKKGDLTAYDTGGYTGEWGNSGKLALLHEKELILNKDDTKNLLSTIEMVRELSDMLDIYAKQSALGLYMNQMATVVQPFTQELQQEVIIKAEFPNATDRNEIQEAFNNLINRASQYAYRNK